MRLAFLIVRKNYYRLLGPVVEEALARGHAVECWHDVSAPLAWEKGAQSPGSPHDAPSFRAGAPAVKAFGGSADLAERWRVDPPDAVVSIDAPDPEVRAAAKVRWVWAQYGAEVLYSYGTAGERTQRGLFDADAVALYSDHWRTRIEERFPDFGLRASLREKASAVGAAELDVLQRVDPAEVRRRFGLPAGRPVVLYLPFPLGSNVQAKWLRNVHAPPTRIEQMVRTAVAGPREYWADARRGRNDWRVVEAMRVFCDANGALLAMKYRAKDPLPRYAARAADLMLDDVSHCPPTILELLAVSALCVHYYSTAVLEAAFAGVPSLCLAPRASELGPPEYGFDFVHNGRPGWIYNAPGVAYWRPLVEAFDGLARWKLGDFPLDPGARRAYVERFLGWDDGRSSARLVDLVERVVAGSEVHLRP